MTHPSGSRAAEQARAGHRALCVGGPLGEVGVQSQLVCAAPNRTITWGQDFRQRTPDVDVDLAVSGARKRVRVWAGSEAEIRSAQAPCSGIGRLVGTRDIWSVAEIVEEHLAPGPWRFRALVGCRASCTLRPKSLTRRVRWVR